jgi:PAS domain S-box-containing protein
MDEQSHDGLEKRVQELTEAQTKLRELENTYDCLQQCLTDAHAIYDANGNACSVSLSFEKMFGWNAQELRGRKIPYVPDEEKERTMRSIREAIAGSPKPFITKRCTKKGDVLDVAISGTRFYDSEGKTGGLIVVLRSIRESHENAAAEQSKFDRRHYRKLFQRHSEGLAIVDSDGSHFRINRRLAKILGLSIREILPSRNWHQIEPLRLLFNNPIIWKLALKNGWVTNYELPYTKRDGTQIRLLVHASILNSAPKGNHTMVLSVADITLRRMKEDHAEKSNQLLMAYCACLEYELTERMKEIESIKFEITKQLTDSQKAQNLARTMMSRMRDQKIDLQIRIQQNLSLTVYPLIEHLRQAKISPAGEHMLDVLEFSIKHITSQFGVRLLSQEAKLSARELQICHMIKAGKDTREIAASLGVAYETVIVHRKNIRKKFGLNCKRQSLAAYMKENM